MVYVWTTSRKQQFRQQLTFYRDGKFTVKSAHLSINFGDSIPNYII